MNYILAEDGETAVPCEDVVEWAKWFEDGSRRKVRSTVVLLDGAEWEELLVTPPAKIPMAEAARDVAINLGAPSIWVSTVFLGIDHNFRDPHPLAGADFCGAVSSPILWETMIFLDGPRISEILPASLDEYQERYSSHADAVSGHERACALVREALARPPAVVGSAG